MNSPIIKKLEFEKVTCGYVPGRNLWEAVTIALPLGETVWIRAKLGGGASSLLRMLAGLLPPISGKIIFNETSFYEAPFDRLVSLKTKLGYGFEEGGLLSNLTLEGNLLLPLRYHGLLSPTESAERVAFYLSQFGMTESKDLRPALASSGMRRSCLLARALIMEPELLLLDDPTRGLSSEMIQRLVGLVEWQRREKNLKHVYFTSEDQDFADRWSQLILEIRDKTLCVSPNEMGRACA